MKNLAMWAVIVFLTIGLYNMFKNPQANVGKGNSIIFSEFLSEVDNGGVVKVDIQGNNIRGVLANGNTFSTYSPNYPNLIEKLSERGVSISAAPLEDKMPSLFGVLLSWFPMLLLIARFLSEDTAVISIIWIEHEFAFGKGHISFDPIIPRDT